MNTKCGYEHQWLTKLSKRGVAEAVALLLLLPLAAGAGGVVTDCTEAALRAAMAGGGAVTFACDGTILLAATIINTSDTTLDASGRQVTISGNNTVRVFQVNTNVNFTVVNLTIADGYSHGGSALLNLGGTVNLTGVSFRANLAFKHADNDSLSTPTRGGAILNRGGTVNASDCSFAGNTAWDVWATMDAVAGQPACGGAIRNEAGEVDLRSCVFVGNSAIGRSGGPNTDPPFAPGEPGLGGAIHNSGTVTLDLCTLASNSAYGGSGTVKPYGSPGLSGGEGSGGAIFNEGTLTVDRATLCGNAAKGGVGSAGGPGASGTYFEGYPGGNGGGANGAAICNLGSLWVARSTLVSNVVAGGAGGAGGDGVLYADRGGNGGRGGDGGSGLGGALFNSGAASLVNCTIAFNTGSGANAGAGGAGAGGTRYAGSGGAGGNGGSGFGGVDGTCSLTNCTLAWNRGTNGSGGAGGAAGSGQYPGQPGPTGTNGVAYGGTVCSALANTLIASNTPTGGDSFPDPKLGPLADNGGPTLTMALLPGSPAIDAGNTSLAPATDQRGVPRPFSLAADIGAFEFWPTLRASPTGSGGIDILASGISGQTCRLLASSNFLNWMPLATNQIGSDGTFLFNVNCAPGSSCRFYRLVMP